MAAPSITWDGTDFQAGGYTLVEFNPGRAQRTWEEVGSYAATYNQQVNVKASALVEMRLLIRVVGSSVSDLQDKIDAIDTICAKASATMTYDPGSDSRTYTTVYSLPCEYVEDTTYYSTKFTALVEVRPMRRP
jgi:hypothetical protein